MEKVVGYQCSVCKTEYTLEDVTYTCPKDGGRERLRDRVGPPVVVDEDGHRRGFLGTVAERVSKGVQRQVTQRRVDRLDARAHDASDAGQPGDDLSFFVGHGVDDTFAELRP